MTLKEQVVAKIGELRDAGVTEFTLGDFISRFGTLSATGATPQKTLSAILSTMAKTEGAAVTRSASGGYTIRSVAKSSVSAQKKTQGKVSVGKVTVSKKRPSSSGKVVSKRPRTTTTASSSTSTSSKAKQGVRRHKKHTKSFKSMIYKVLKQVHPEMGASQKGMKAVDDLTHDFLNNLVDQAKNLALAEGRKTIQMRDVQFATQLLLQGELAKHAVSEGLRAVAKFNASL